jgi:hypothetical protein
MSFIHGALIQKLTQQLEELYQRVVVLEGGKSESKPTAKGGGLKATGEAIEGSEEATNGLPNGSTKELQGVSDV